MVANLARQRKKGWLGTKWADDTAVGEDSTQNGAILQIATNHDREGTEQEQKSFQHNREEDVHDGEFAGEGMSC